MVSGCHFDSTKCLGVMGLTIYDLMIALIFGV
jgi:hypothetical protein